MHKVKKQWVTIAVTGMSLGAVSAVSLGTNDGVVQADEHTDATVAIPDITVDTGTVSNDTTAAQDPTQQLQRMLLIRQRQSVLIVRQLQQIQQQPMIQLLIQQITTLQLTQQQLLIAQRHVNVVRLVLDVVLQEAVVLPQLTAILTMPTILSQ